MKITLYSVYDSKAEFFQNPIAAQREGDIVRKFGDLCRNPDTEYGAHPEDYALFRVGDFDESNAEIHGNKTPFKVITGLECTQGQDA